MLSGLKILDLSRVLAGPLCTMMLGDLGASVLKVERPDGGDETRGWGPPFDDRGESAYFLSINRNKLSLTADFAVEADVALIRRLAAQADVVVENFRAGTLERRGLGAAELMAGNPRLVWCTISGFGATVSRPGYDFVVQAESGWMSVTGEPGGAPMKHGVALVDVITGKDAVISILGALVARGVTGRGRVVQVSLEASARAALINVAQNALVSGSSPRRWGNAHANLVPYQLFDASDRPLVIAVGNDGQWVSCVRALGLNELEAEDALQTNAGRIAARDRIVMAITRRLRDRPAAEWVKVLDAAGVPCGVVRTVPEALAGSDVSALTGMPPSVVGSVRRAPPLLGEHTLAVRERGWGAFDG